MEGVTADADHPTLSPLARQVAEQLAATALRRVQDRATGGVRVEDYITVLASMTGDAAFIVSGAVDIETSDIAPGAPVFGDQINHLLSDDTTDLSEVTPSSVVGTLVDELVPSTYDRADFGSLDSIYRLIVANVGKHPWGQVVTSVPSDNAPTVLPIQVAFELRPTVDAAMDSAELPAISRHVLCAVALATGLRQVRTAIDPHVAMALALEVTFGVAKMMPMSKRAFLAASEGPSSS
jgi:hypothetical protein